MFALPPTVVFDRQPAELLATKIKKTWIGWNRDTHAAPLSKRSSPLRVALLIGDIEICSHIAIKADSAASLLGTFQPSWRQRFIAADFHHSELLLVPFGA